MPTFFFQGMRDPEFKKIGKDLEIVWVDSCIYIRLLFLLRGPDEHLWRRCCPAASRGKMNKGESDFPVRVVCDSFPINLTTKLLLAKK
jgi:hypothetical protein